MIRPLGHRLFVRLNEPPQEYKGLTLVHQEHYWQRKTVTALVLSIGDQVDADIFEGDEIVMRGDAGRWIDKSMMIENGENGGTSPEEHSYKSIEDHEVLAIVTPVTPMRKKDARRRTTTHV